MEAVAVGMESRSSSEVGQSSGQCLDPCLR